MELFVINRHEEQPPKTTEDEKSNLDKIFTRIERKKQQRQRQREREKLQKQLKTKKITERLKKHQQKAKLIPVPDNTLDEFIEKKPQETIKEHKKPQPVNTENFTILGGDSFTQQKKVKRVLPNWLSHPTVISSNLHNTKNKVSKLKSLNKTIREKLKSNNIKYLFPVQAEVIPWLLQVNDKSEVLWPPDLCVSAPTGSGKTLAFVLPVIQALSKFDVRKIRALVILPTQDLAAQVFKAFKCYSSENLEVCLLTGKNLFEHEQKQLVYFNEAFGYVSKVDIVVCTAGRLVDHLKHTKGLNFNFLQFLVIDEADRVLDSVQDDWLYHLEKHILQEHKANLGVSGGKALNLLSLQKPRPPQKLLFSATLSQDPEKLQKLSLFQPKLFTSVVEGEEADDASFIGRFTTPKELSEKYIVCSKNLKPLVLYKFIKNESLTKTIIFTHSIESGHRLAILLKSLFKNKLKIEEISSSLTGKRRDELIVTFSNGEIDLLICTDSLARGIDLPGIRCVISYSAPKFLKTYIHRAGRTARAGESGLAVTLLHNEQLAKFMALLAQSKKTDIEELDISEEDLEPLSELYKKSLSELKETVESEEKVGLKKLMGKKKGVKVGKK